VFSQGRVFAADSAGPGMTFVEAVAMAEAQLGTLSAVGSYSPPKAPGKYKGAGVGPSPAYSFTACVVETEVDERTGWVHVPKIWIAHDIGRALNPTLARGQVIGGVDRKSTRLNSSHLGISYAVFCLKKETKE